MASIFLKQTYVLWLKTYCRISVACDTMEFEFILLSPPLCGPLHLTFPGDVAYACTYIQQVT